MRASAPAKVGADSAAVAAVVRAAMVRAASEVGAAHAVLPTVRLLARLAVESLAREVILIEVSVTCQENADRKSVV